MPPARRFSKVEPSPRGSEKAEPALAASSEGHPLGRLLVESGAITAHALEAALVSQRRTFLPLGRILRDEHALPPAALADALRRLTYVPRLYLRFFPVERDAALLLDHRFCLEHEVLAFERLGNLLCVAFSNPAVRSLCLRLRVETGCEIAPFQAPWDDIQRKLNLYA
jgi:hypothetical protein